MKKEVLEKIRQYLEKQQKEEKKKKRLQESLETLQNHPAVKEYFKVKQELDTYILKEERTEEEWIAKAFLLFQEKGPTNSIYVYQGTFLESDLRVNYHHPASSYRLFKNLEDEKDMKKIPLSNCTLFEQKNEVLYVEEEDIYKGYYRLQNEFLSLCVHDGEQEAIKVFLARTKV